MIYRRKTYKITPNKLDEFNDFFHTYLYPNQMKHGAKLIGRWANEAGNEITAIWKYDSFSHYKYIEEQIGSSSLYQKAQEQKKKLGMLYYESKQEFLTSTAEPSSYHPPKHIVSAASVILNETNDLL